MVSYAHPTAPGILRPFNASLGHDGRPSHAHDTSQSSLGEPIADDYWSPNNHLGFGMGGGLRTATPPAFGPEMLDP
ncbi:hypothetical protein PMIN06_012531 [Paraphaeosphaeria minitans]|uniref:Uncharacterized protein n=1 Tax=Paraphaeosphaeria minitans TaxID=565426 RepID=A0A9P6KPA3_9PLEO|nr:hypothetical protein PMIN01_08159 [Paraphaeosphaeria minitans]KAF9733882.1 hypothetical protein PMIN01_08225 [Paraphaeosphaeria minitans]